MGDATIITLAHCPPVEKRELEFEEHALTETLHVIDIFVHCFFGIVILNEGEDEKRLLLRCLRMYSNSIDNRLKESV